MKKELTWLESCCKSIRNNIKECGKLYILVAYKVYEIYYYETYKEKYKNIVECCENEFCFKKSTTYNLLNIVKKFGVVENGMITYNSVCRYTDYSYKQLVCMLRLSSEQLEKITPDTTIAEIHKEKKVQPVGKIKNSVISDTLKTIEKTSELQNNVIEETQNNEKSFEEIEELKHKLKIAEDKSDSYFNQIRDLKEVIRYQTEKISSLENDNKILKKKVEFFEKTLENE